MQGDGGSLRGEGGSRSTSEEKKPLKPEPGTHSNSCTKRHTRVTPLQPGGGTVPLHYLCVPSEGRLQPSHGVHHRKLLKDGAAESNGVNAPAGYNGMKCCCTYLG